MTIKLPKQIIDYQGEAHIKDGILYVEKRKFEAVMYFLTYQMMKSNKCYYCGEKLTAKNRSIDHLYPRDLGGVSITNNLVPACKMCNSKKGNMTEKEFRAYLAVLENTPERKDEFLMEVAERHSEVRRTFGVILPSKWYQLLEDYNVLAPVFSADRYRSSKSYIRIANLYETYGRLCKPIMVSENNILLDGFNALMFAKNLPTKIEVPYIKLDNVIAY